MNATRFLVIKAYKRLNGKLSMAVAKAPSKGHHLFIATYIVAVKFLALFRTKYKLTLICTCETNKPFPEGDLNKVYFKTLNTDGLIFNSLKPVALRMQ